MTTPTDPHARARKALTLPETRGLALDAQGAPWASTDGHLLVLRGVASLDEARARLEASTAASAPPGVRWDVDPRMMIRVLDHAAKSGPRSAGVLVSRKSQADGERAQAAREEQERAVAECERVLAQRLVDLDRAREAKRGGVARAQASVTAAREALRSAKRPGPYTRAVEAGEGRFDLALVKRALRQLGAASGRLEAAEHPLDAAVLVTDAGLALVMPLR